RPDIDGLVQALVTRRGDTVVVSEEVGLGVHPVSEVGRLFADRLGEANRRVAEVADRCILVVAGRIIELPQETGSSPPHAGPSAPPRGPWARGTARPPGGPVGQPAALPPVGGLRQAVAFLTPLGGAAAPSPTALTWFPLVGALLGAGLGGIWAGADDRLGPL